MLGPQFSRFQPLKTYIDAFRRVIDYLRYHLTNHTAYIESVATISLHKVKRDVDVLYLTLEAFSCK